MPFFEIENCAVALTFLNEPDTLRDTISVQGLKNYDDGIVVADFENGAPPVNAIVYKEPNGANMTFFAENDNPLLGKHYFKMGGTVAKMSFKSTKNYYNYIKNKNVDQ